MAKIAEDPFCDQQKWINDFTDGYYGKAAPYIRKYLKFVNDAAMNDNKSHVATQSPMEKCEYVTPEFTVAIQNIFIQAAAAVRGNTVLLERVNHARLAADKAAYILYNKIKKGALKESREDIAARINRTVETRSAMMMKDVLPQWKKRHDNAKNKYEELKTSISNYQSGVE